jgi:hypothetical protein
MMNSLPPHIKKWIRTLPKGSFEHYMQLYRRCAIDHISVEDFFRELYAARACPRRD